LRKKIVWHVFSTYFLVLFLLIIITIIIIIIIIIIFVCNKETVITGTHHHWIDQNPPPPPRATSQTHREPPRNPPRPTTTQTPTRIHQKSTPIHCTKPTSKLKINQTHQMTHRQHLKIKQIWQIKKKKTKKKKNWVVAMTGQEIERATPQPKLATHREPTPRRPTATRANPPKILNKPIANSHRKHTATATTANHKSIPITPKTNRKFLP
jgi:hypothetical protein